MCHVCVKITVDEFKTTKNHQDSNNDIDIKYSGTHNPFYVGR